MGIFYDLMGKFSERGRAKASPTKTSDKTGPKEPPAQMQLPGGVVIKGYAFRITSCDAQGRPTSFELVRGNENSDCVLWASPSFIDQRLPEHLDQRWRRRVEESIEGPGSYDTQERTYTKERAHGISEVTCGYEPCDGGPCLRPEAHEARERGEETLDE